MNDIKSKFKLNENVLLIKTNSDYATGCFEYNIIMDIDDSGIAIKSKKAVKTYKDKLTFYLDRTEVHFLNINISDQSITFDNEEFKLGFDEIISYSKGVL